MYQTQSFHPASPLLGRYEPSLPAVSYYDPAWFEREQKQIWARNWVYAGRSNDLSAMTMRRLSVAGQNLILVKDQDGSITCFHNTCRHRGSELCSAAERSLTSRLIVCPYHQWSYSLSGKLVRDVVCFRDWGLSQGGLRAFSGPCARMERLYFRLPRR